MKNQNEIEIKSQIETYSINESTYWNDDDSVNEYDQALDRIDNQF